MSLRVWLPLDGNLRNQGISNITPNNMGGITTNTSGKIGSCMSFNGSGTGYLRMPAILTATDNFSICFWMKLNNNTANHCLYSQRINATANGFSIFYITGSGIRFDDGASLIMGTTLNANQWYHIVCCRDNSKKYIYINGLLNTSDAKNNTNASNVNTNYSLIGGSQNTTAGDIPNANYFNGYLNDYRIYDHCLSAAEVKEIAQGLVLHYKLDKVPSTITNAYGTPYFDANSANGGWNHWGRAGAVGSQGINTDIQYIYYKDKARNHYVTNSADATGEYLVYQSPAFEGGYRSLQCIVKETNSMPITESILFPAWNNRDGGAPGNKWTRVMPLGNGFYLCQVDGVHQDGNNDLIGFYVCPGYTIYFSFACCENDKQLCSDILFSSTEIQDSSGYNHNGTIVGSVVPAADTARYSVSTHIDGAGVITATTPGADIRTLSCWVKTTKNKSTSQMLVADSGSNMCISFYSGTIIGVFGTTRSTGSKCTLGASYKENDWNHIVVVKTSDDGKRDIYCNGEKLTPAADDYWSAAAGFYVGNRNGTGSGNTPFFGYISDVRAYCTPLLDTDIKQLYNIGMKIDKFGSVHSFEFIEQQSNMIFPIELSRSNLEFTNGLNRYTQSNCQVTLTDQGYHIYRPPNLTTANDGNTMWGGLKLVNQKTDTIAAYDSNRDNNWGLQKGHTYFAAFHAKGKSSNSTSWGWANNMGWSGGGVNASPTIITNIGIPSDFQGEKDCIFIFTINDDIAKNCTSAYSSYVANTTYLSYRHLTFGWGYSSTGTLGTDLYLTDLRLYDITNYMAKITKQGQAKFYDFVEQLNKAQIRRKSEFLSSNFIER